MLREKFDSIPSFYKPEYVLDNDFNTRWQSADTVGAPAWIMIDLEKETTISSVEIIFEYVLKKYGYTLEYLSGKKAKSFEEAKQSKKWLLYASNIQNSPTYNSKKVEARFIKLSIKSVDLPRGKDYQGAIKLDFENHPSVVEFKVYGE